MTNLRQIEHDCIGPLGPFPPVEQVKLPETPRREVIIINRTVKECVGNRIVETWKMGNGE